MSVARFDPRNLARYEKAPDLLHLEFGRDGRVYRYAMVQAFPAGELDPDTRRTAAERAARDTHAMIRARLIK